MNNQSKTNPKASAPETRIVIDCGYSPYIVMQGDHKIARFHRVDHAEQFAAAVEAAPETRTGWTPTKEWVSDKAAHQPQPADQWKQWAMSYKAHADKLAEALQPFVEKGASLTTPQEVANACKALAEYQNARRGESTAGGE